MDCTNRDFKAMFKGWRAGSGYRLRDVLRQEENPCNTIAVG